MASFRGDIPPTNKHQSPKVPLDPCVVFYRCCLELLNTTKSKIIEDEQRMNYIRAYICNDKQFLLQGLDPRATAILFSDATCIGEKIIGDEDCFILKLETSPAIREAQSGPNFEIIHHTIWGYFSQRSGLLIQFEDSRLLRMRTNNDEDVFWETSAESVMEDYKYVDNVNIAHSGRTRVTVFRYGEQSANHKRELEETWKIDEVDFNVWGLTMESFLPPADNDRKKENNVVV